MSVPSFTTEAVKRYTSSSLEELQRSRSEGVEHWRAVGASLHHVPDADLDLLDRGPQRFSSPLQAVGVARYDADTTGFVRYDQLFADRPDPVPQPTPLPDRNSAAKNKFCKIFFESDFVLSVGSLTDTTGSQSTKWPPVRPPRAPVSWDPGTHGTPNRVQWVRI